LEFGPQLPPQHPSPSFDILTQGDLISSGPSEEQWRYAAYWDADLLRQVWLDGRLRNLAAQRDCPPVFEGKLVGLANVLGDWREELITSLKGELRIYTTTIPALDRRTCLLRDPIYRMGVCAESQGYFSLPGFRSLPGADR
jgi:rhamnogalacturonan endolyase